MWNRAGWAAGILVTWAALTAAAVWLDVRTADGGRPPHEPMLVVVQAAGRPPLVVPLPELRQLGESVQYDIDPPTGWVTLPSGDTADWVSTADGIDVRWRGSLRSVTTHYRRANGLEPVWTREVGVVQAGVGLLVTLLLAFLVAKWRAR